MMSTSEFLGIRLIDIRSDGSKRAAKAIDGVMRRQSAIGMLASGNSIYEIEKALAGVYRDILDIGASFIAEADPDHSQQHVGALDQFARAFECDVLRQYDNDFGRMEQVSLRFDHRQGELSRELDTIRDRVVGDFKFGLAGGKRMASRPSIQNNVTIMGSVIGGSPVIAPGGTVNQANTVTDGDIRALVDSILNELTLATSGEAEARRLAEEAKAELAKAKPDRSVVVKLLTGAGNGLLAIGKTVLGEIAKEAAKGYARDFGIIPPNNE